MGSGVSFEEVWKKGMNKNNLPAETEIGEAVLHVDFGSHSETHHEIPQVHHQVDPVKQLEWFASQSSSYLGDRLKRDLNVFWIHVLA